MSPKTYQICEYGKVMAKPAGQDLTSNLSELYLGKEVFQEFYEAIMQLQSEESDGAKAFGISIKKGRHQISVKNYTGILETSKGYQLEILPKIHFNRGIDELSETKRILMNMLKRLKNSPFININEASIKTHKNYPILEVFISAFIEELHKLIRIGLKSDYLDVEENLNSLKGKILIHKNLKLNYSNKSRFYCRHNLYSEDNSANRLIKSCLLKLRDISKNHRNLSSIQSLLIHFDLIKLSNNYESDFQLVASKRRGFSKYERILSWADVFLRDASFTNFSGSTRNLAILFPMERIFEDYIGYLFQKYSQGRRIKLQDRSFFLVERHKNAGKFRLKPDIVAMSGEVSELVLDTKWKLINQYAEKKNYYISQADMYQLYAYGKKYAKEKSPLLVLIYPSNPSFTKPIELFNYEGDLNLLTYPFDLSGKEEDHALQVMEILSSQVSQIS